MERALYFDDMEIEKTTSLFFELFRSLMDECEMALEWNGEVPAGISIRSYGELYELPVQQIGAYLFKQAGLLEAADAAASRPDANLRFLELAQTVKPDVELDPSTAMTTIVSMIVLFTNIESMMLFSMPISELLERVSSGDDSAVFEAVLLDASVMNTKPIANRIATASFYDDRSFFHRLSQAITRTKPARPRRHLDETRLLMQLLDEAGELDGLSDSKLTELAVNVLGLLPKLSDPQSSIRDQRRKRNKSKEGPKS